MSKYFKIIALAFLLSQSVDAQVTVHVLNPWRNDSCAGHRDSLLVEGFNNGLGVFNSAWADRAMTPEGGNWFYFTYASRSNSFVLASYCGPATWQGWVTYKNGGSNGFNFNIDSLLLRFPTGTNELWITIGDSTQPPQFYDKPQKSKVIYIFNPWPNNSSQISIDNRPPMKMQSRTDICGWYTCYYVGPVDSLYNVYFTDYFHTQKYTSSGLAIGPPIDLRAMLSTKDTVYILPKPFPYGPPGLYSTFPGQTGDCGVRKVSGIFRDWKLDNISFFNDPMGARSGGKGMVQTILQPPDYKPQLTAAAAAANPPNPPVSSWYKTYIFGNGRQNDTCIDLTLKKSDDGTWTFNSDDMGGFFPLDNFNDSNNIKYSDHLNPTDPASKFHNYHFSMEMHLQFVYYQNAGLVFDFTGDDDLWIFVNNHLAVDLGGLNNRVSDTFDVDKRNISLGLGLVNGQTYNMDIFYAERNPIGSNLIIQTTMDLENSANLYYVATVLGPGKTQYFILEHVQSNNKTCGFTPLFNQIDTPTVKFFIQGPQFLQPFQLQKGSQFNNGIIVDGTNPIVTLDSAVLDTSLAPGDYHITFTSTVDSTRTGYLVFTVPPLPPNHLDILTDSTVMNPAKDAVIDSIFMPMDLPTTQVYAVLRDILGEYLSNASSETWTSRDTSVVTVAPLPGDKSRAVITKKGTGSTWVVVTQNGLRPDSVRVSAIALPGYPIISSAVMLDTNADIVPDMLSITLNDTFHTDQKLDSVEITYRGRTYGIPASKTILAGKMLFVPFPGVTSDAQPSGTAAIFMNVSAAEKSYSKAFTDGVGPALISASVLENDGPDPDILYLAFSEPVTLASLMGKQLLLMSAASSDTVRLTVTDYTNMANDSVFTITLSASDRRALSGDRLRLLPGSQGGAISDMSANKPHDLNRSVVLGFRAGPTPVVSAYYLDVNADGYLDRMIVGFKRPVQLPDVSVIIAQWNIQPAFQYDTIAVNSVVKINDSLYSMPLHGSAIRPAQVRTGPAMEVDVQYGAFPGIIRSLPVADSAGPVLLDTAKLVYGNSPDSIFLIIPFSESVQRPGSHPFVAWSKKYGVQYQMDLTWISTNGNVDLFHVDAIEGGTVLNAGNGDSIWINTDSLPLVRDVSGFPQRDSLNHRVALHVVTQPPKWGVYISKNPFTAAAETGPEIAIVSESPVFDADQYSLKISIFDVIGNLVITMPMQPKGKGWACSWDGRNRNARFVGSGVYSAIIKIYKNNLENSTKRIRIGVKR